MWHLTNRWSAYRSAVAHDRSKSNRPVWFSDLSSDELRRQIASHEAGHAVVGVGMGFVLNHITLGLGEEQINGGIVAGGCAFDAPGGDHNELARQRPDDFAVVALAGVFAERLLTDRFLRGGFEGDIQILRIGFGWLDGIDSAQTRSRFELLQAAAQTQVLRWRQTIERIVDLLIQDDHLDGGVVHELVDELTI